MNLSPRITVIAAAALSLSVHVGCREPGARNTPPTVVITEGPSAPVLVDSVRFEWSGSDVDGSIAGYLFAVDDTAPDSLVQSAGITLRGLSFGDHDFYVRSVDDSGAQSVAAVWPFSFEYQGAVQRAGTDSAFDIATWNIENFPKDGMQTVKQLRWLVPWLDLDVYAVEEIADTIAFNELLAGLSGYSGLYSRDDYGSSYQKTGVIYKTGTVRLSDVEQLFWRNSAFPRPPLAMTVTASGNGWTFDFRLIVLHLKAGYGDEDRQRRAEACVALKQYIDTELGSGAEQDFIVVGDWNDELNDPVAENVFSPFLDDSAHYRFLTIPLVGNPEQVSYIGGDLIDHVLVTSDALVEYGLGRTVTLRLDDEVAQYQDEVSDHRPVMSSFAWSLARHPAEEQLGRNQHEK